MPHNSVCSTDPCRSCPAPPASQPPQVRLRREKVALSPVYYTALQSEDVQAGGPRSRFSLASAPALKDQEEPLTAAGSLYGTTSGDAYSSTARGHNPLPALPAAAGPLGRGGAGAGAAVQQGEVGAPRWGYLRLTSFSQNAAEETKHAIQSLEVRMDVGAWGGGRWGCPYT